MSISFKKTILNNAEVILDLQQQCFKKDFLEYEDYETNPYCETLEDVKRDIYKSTFYYFFRRQYSWSLRN